MKEKKKRTRRLFRRIKFRYVLIVFALGIGIHFIINRPNRIPINTSGDDVLYYTYANSNQNVDDPNKGMLMMYDPRTNQHKVLMDSPRQYLISPIGWIAYHNEGKNIIISDVQDSDNLHAIILTLSDNPRLLSWSYDGHYLAYTDVDSLGEQSIYIWDGETSINITPNELVADATSYYVAPSYSSDSVSGWSTDGRFIFSVAFQESSVGGELYIWNGEITYNLSQNPIGDDQNASWSPDRRVAYFSEIDGQYYIKVWDSINTLNTGLTVGISDVYHNLAWAPNNNLAYKSEFQIYVWNGEISTKLDHPPKMGFNAEYNHDGFLAFTSLSSPIGHDHNYVHIRDPYNKTIEVLAGYYSAWSKDGYLAYCMGKGLFLFDGENTVRIANAEYSSVGTWQSGQSLWCMTSA